jgi:predicted MFS family arabinose efflux permease
MNATMPADSLGPPATGVRTRQLTLLALFLVSVFNYVDRTILSILQIPIKAELGLSDGQMGALTGLAFALFYSACSLPIARITDTASRKMVVLCSLAFWSLMTALTGLATSFAMLIIFRIGVAVGEAGSVPASVSLLSDNYPPVRRATAMSTWGLALPVGLTLGYSATGWLADAFGWRIAFAIVGGAGILLVPLVFALLTEPPRGRYDPPEEAAREVPPLRESLQMLWRIKGFRYAVLGVTLHGFTQYAMMSWNAPFFARTHGLSLTQVAVLMALLSGVGGAIGMYLGGFVADRLALRDPRWRVWVIALVVGGTVPAALIQYLAGPTAVSIVAASVAAALMVAYYGPLLAVTQSVIPPQMRAFSNAVMGLVFNLVGLGLGPWVTGMCSDILDRYFGLGDQSLGYALVLSLVSACAGAAVFLYAARFWTDGTRSANGGKASA